jgi:hypothetical protein
MKGIVSGKFFDFESQQKSDAFMPITRPEFRKPKDARRLN